MHDSLSAATLSIAIMGGSAIKNGATTQLIPRSEGSDAMKKPKSLLVSPEKDQMLERQ